MDLIQLIKKIWEHRIYNQDDYLFRINEPDFSLYFIDDWEIILEKDGKSLINITKNQIIWEKSFIEKQNKPLSARVIEKSEIYVLTQEKYLLLELDQRNEFLSMLIIFLSQRVNKMNEILSIIGSLNQDLIQLTKLNEFDNINKYLDKIINLENYIILKNHEQEYIRISWNLLYTSDIYQFIYWFLQKDIKVKIWKNYLYLNTWYYIFVLQWEMLVDSYILVNSLMYSDSIMNYLWEKIEENNEKNFIYNNYVNE